ncbi:nitrate- and nitrite sensing domain-containing protein [Streptomyces sp. HUAS TT7]|uniref:sensor histidine kinase n=1 Tax=Streptomyces sp. HUAS TT7 TaxID=3447507 RepID=UPI003F65FACE
MSIRTQMIAVIAVPLAALIALWGYSQATVSNDVWGLRSVSDSYQRFGAPVDGLTRGLQAERLAAVAYLANHDAQGADQTFLKAGQQSDRLVETIREHAQGDGSDALDAEQRKALSALLGAVGQLTDLRQAVSGGTASVSDVTQRYGTLISTMFRFRTSFTGSQADRLAQRAAVLAELNRAQEYVSQEEAALTVLSSQAKPDAGLLRILDNAVEAHRLLFGIYLPELHGADRPAYDQLTRQSAWGAMGKYEDAFLENDFGLTHSLPHLAEWRTTASTVERSLGQLNTAFAERVSGQAAADADRLSKGNMTAGGISLLAIGVSVLLSVLLGRRLVKQLLRLRDSARDLAHHRLPQVMERLRSGESVDGQEAVPALEVSRDEIGQVALAFNVVRLAAVEAAVNQAELRTAASEVFVSLARRSQGLVQRQHAVLDEMERLVEDPDELAQLYRLDHLTTRMRRHAEGLIVLSGGSPRRGPQHPIRMLDLVRAAVSEVETYTRIALRPFPDSSLIGPAVADVTHLVAELLENATQYSPPHTQATAHGERVANGYVIEINDRGLGMRFDALEDANRRLAQDLEFDRVEAERLGLFVVGRLAHRHGVKVTLRRSPYGGTCAIVLIPECLLVENTTTTGDGARPSVPVPSPAPSLGSGDGDTSRAAQDASARGPQRRSGAHRRSGTRPPEIERLPAVPRQGEGSTRGGLPRPDTDVRPLPRRVRQPRPIPGTPPSPTPADATAAVGTAPGPEAARATFSAYQRGLAAGRADAGAPRGSTSFLGSQADLPPRGPKNRTPDPTPAQPGKGHPQ